MASDLFAGFQCMFLEMELGRIQQARLNSLDMTDHPFHQRFLDEHVHGAQQEVGILSQGIHRVNHRGAKETGSADRRHQLRQLPC